MGCSLFVNAHFMNVFCVNHRIIYISVISITLLHISDSDYWASPELSSE